MSILQVEHVTHSYGDKTILRDVSFRLFAGEHVGLVGLNGAGKSTLMRILTGELIPDQGNVRWLPGIEPGYLEQHFEPESGDTVRDVLRGAFAPLFRIEKETLQLAERMASCAGSELDGLLRRYADALNVLEASGFYSLDATIEKVAAGLGLTAIGLDTAVRRLSGGQRTKVLLAKLLLQQPKALLLDEPTNYLDADHVAWLADYLKSYPHAFILISHDTAFLQAVVNVIYHLEHQQLMRYAGSYTDFLSAYELRKHQVWDAYERQQEEIRKLETYIQKNKARASTAKLAKSREKRLDKIERIERPSLSPKPNFAFRVHVQPAGIVMEAKRLVVGYDRALLPPFDVKLKRGAKVAIVGANGIGKSTTLKTVLGFIPPLGGEVSLGDRAHPAYFAQHVSSEAEHTALEEIWSAFPTLTQKQVRTALARCGLRSELALKPLKTLSGGEQTKVRLCRLMLSDSNWLVLDEPTNHLDTEAKAALQQALRAYSGTVLVVTHEPEFYEDWVTDVWNLESWRKPLFS